MDAAVPMAPATSTDFRHRTIIGWWLFAMCAMVFVMVVLGGVTRLTQSGLSIVDWRPVTGWLPPLSDARWHDLFEAYKRFPEFQKLNQGMSLAEFKTIFWFEYVHRLWGRLIGVAFFVPFAYFLVRGWVDRTLAPRLAVIFLVGALQGAMGWYMVKSGLVDRPDVSQYRLTAHLALAVGIYAYMFWLGLRLVEGARAVRTAQHEKYRRYAMVIAAWVFVTMLSGGFVAGLDAGFGYNTFPTMDGQWIPDGVGELTPWYLNLFENRTTVQFDHRLLAETLFVLVVIFWIWGRRLDLPARARRAVHALGAMAVVQPTLGITTLLFVIPVPLAALHQAGALVLLTAALWVLFELQPIEVKARS